MHTKRATPFSLLCILAISLQNTFATSKPEPLEPSEDDKEESASHEDTEGSEHSNPGTSRPKITIRDIGDIIGSLELKQIRFSDLGEEDFLIWTVDKKGDAVLTDLTDYTKFKPDKSYIILPVATAPWKMAFQYWNLYYWIGRHSSIVDVITVAKFGVQISDAIFPTVKIKREVEGHESYAFKAIFESKESGDIPVAETSEIDDLEVENEDNHRVKRMFQITATGANDLYLREVELSVHHTLEEESCLVLNAEMVYVHCGHATSKLQKDGAAALASILMKIRKLEGEPIEIHRRREEFADLQPEEQEKLAQFLTDFNPVPDSWTKQPIADNLLGEFTPEEMRKILCQTRIIGHKDQKEIFRLKATKISHKGDVENIPFDYIPLKQIDKKDCYLVDTRSNLGLYVWMGEDSSIQLRKRCVRLAELSSRKAYHSYQTNITIVDEKDLQESINHLERTSRDPLELSDIISLMDPYCFLEGIGIPDKDHWSFLNKRHRPRGKARTRMSIDSSPQQSLKELRWSPAATRGRLSLRHLSLQPSLSFRNKLSRPTFTVNLSSPHAPPVLPSISTFNSPYELRVSPFL